LRTTVNKEVKRRADVVGILPSEASIIRLIGAVLLKANDGWQMQHRPPTQPCNFDPRPPEPWPSQAHQKYPPRWTDVTCDSRGWCGEAACIPDLGC
jgi:hypothetical protein